MATVTIHAAKTNLSKLLARVEAGEEIILARGKRPIAKLTPYVPQPSKRKFGAFQGVVTVGPEFFEPLPEEELAGWEERVCDYCSTPMPFSGGSAATPHSPPERAKPWPMQQTTFLSAPPRPGRSRP